MEDIVAILCMFGWPLALIGLAAFRTYLKHQQEMLDRKLLAQSQANGQTQSDVEGLRKEIALLRDTSTQYDISIEHTLNELQRRVAMLESRNLYGKALSNEEARQEMATGRGEL